MEKILLLRRSVKNSGEIRIRFRLLDGRKADLFHKPSFHATIEDLDKFDEYGNLKPKVRVYNIELEDKITREKNLMHEVYRDMVENGYDINSETFERKIQERINPVNAEREQGDTLLSLFKDYAESSLRDGIFGENRYKHINVVYGKLERFLKIKGQTLITPREFDEEKLWEFRAFIVDEYKYVEQYPRLYEDFKPRNLTTVRLSMNTAVSQMKMLQAFFNSLDQELLSRSPFEALGKDRKGRMMRTMYDEPVFLTAEEFRRVMDFEAPKWLQDTKDAFLLQCAFGFRIGDFQSLTMDNVAVSEEGIPYIHYLPNKTKRVQEYNSEIQTPIIRYAFEIIKRTQLHLKEIAYASGTNGYNAKIKSLLKLCKINRMVPTFNEDTGKNEYVPIYLLASSKLCRKTFVDMMHKVQLNPYIAGLHKEGSTAVYRYTNLSLKEMFILMSTAFGQEVYYVDQHLNII